MEITTTTYDGAPVLMPAGRVETTTSADPGCTTSRQIGQGNRKLLINFSGVTSISGEGLRVLPANAKKLRNPDDRYALCCLSAEVHKVLKLAGFTSIFSIYPSEGEALERW
jgi:anti-sigma B factor antagonist